MITQLISGKCFTRVLNEYKQQHKWRGKLTDADLFSNKIRAIGNLQSGGLTEISLPDIKLN